MVYPEHFSDPELIKLLQYKDKDAFSLLYDTYAPSLYGVLLKLVKNDRLATEILEKVFLNIWSDCTTLSNRQQSIFVRMYSMTYKMAKAELSSLPREENTLVDLAC